jgi:predicted amidohydrolase YtcJ
MKEWASKIGSGSDKVWINSMGALAIDGAGARRCMSTERASSYDAVLDSYWPMGACNIDSEYHGAAGKSPRTSGNYFRDWMLASGRYGVRFANTHVAGERAVKLLLDLAQMSVQESGPNAVKNWAFDHCTYVNPDDLPRAARMGITFSCAPKYIISAGEATARAYGESAANNWVVPIKSMLNNGIKVALESDRDVSIWAEMELMMTRKDSSGKVWGPQERVDRITALKTGTIWAAEYILKGNQLGSLETGKLADLVVLDRDYMAIPVEQIHEIQPQVTVFDGKIVFVHSQFAQEYNLRPAGAVVSTYEALMARRPDAAGGGD